MFDIEVLFRLRIINAITRSGDGNTNKILVKYKIQAPRDFVMEFCCVTLTFQGKSLYHKKKIGYSPE